MIGTSEGSVGAATPRVTKQSLGNRANFLLALSGKSWFAVAAIGQAIFTLYIITIYGISLLGGNIEHWNTVSAHGYVPGDQAGNIMMGMHVLLAAIVSIGGPLQLIPKMRRIAPRFHRWNGRIYILAAFIISLSGIYLIWVRGSVGGLIGAIATSTNGLFILAFAIPTVRLAMAKKYQKHLPWAWRLFMVMSGVWFFRVGIMLWLLIWQRPVGFNPETFQGPFLSFLNFAQFLLPLALVEVFFWVKKNGSQKGKLALSAFYFVCALATAAGIFAATMGMWGPRMVG